MNFKIKWYFKFALKACIWIVPGSLIGGMKKKSEKDRIRRGLNILIATPGRLCDHLDTTIALDLSKIDYLIFDEADRYFSNNKFQCFDWKNLRKYWDVDTNSLGLKVVLLETIHLYQMSFSTIPVKTFWNRPLSSFKGNHYHYHMVTPRSQAIIIVILLWLVSCLSYSVDYRRAQTSQPHKYGTAVAL